MLKLWRDARLNDYRSVVFILLMMYMQNSLAKELTMIRTNEWWVEKDLNLGRTTVCIITIYRMVSNHAMVNTNNVP